MTRKSWVRAPHVSWSGGGRRGKAGGRAGWEVCVLETRRSNTITSGDRCGADEMGEKHPFHDSAGRGGGEERREAGREGVVWRGVVAGGGVGRAR